MLHLGELQTYRSDLVIYYHARIGSFRIELDSFAMGTKADMLPILAYMLGGKTHMSLLPSNV